MMPGASVDGSAPHAVARVVPRARLAVGSSAALACGPELSGHLRGERALRALLRARGERRRRRCRRRPTAGGTGPSATPTVRRATASTTRPPATSRSRRRASPDRRGHDDGRARGDPADDDDHRAGADERVRAAAEGPRAERREIDEGASRPPSERRARHRCSPATAASPACPTRVPCRRRPAPTAARALPWRAAAACDRGDAGPPKHDERRCQTRARRPTQRACAAASSDRQRLGLGAARFFAIRLSSPRCPRG